MSSMHAFQFIVLAWILTSQVAYAEEEVCVEGYLMDVLCIERGTLMDNPSIATLAGPDQHSVMCLIDIDACRESGFEVLMDPLDSADLHCRGYRLDAAGNDMVVAYARQHGSCTSCNGTGTVERGLRATVRGAVVQGSGSATEPPTLRVTSVAEDGVGCGVAGVEHAATAHNDNCVAPGAGASQ